MADSQNREFSETVAREIAQQVAQAVSQSIQKAMQTGQSQESKQEEVGMGERYRVESGDRSAMMFANNKVHLDEHAALLAEIHQDARKALAEERSYVTELRQDARKALAEIGTLSALGVKGAVTSDALITKQAIAHRDIAVDSTWVPGPGEEKPEE